MLGFLKTLFSPKVPNAAEAWQLAGNQAGNAYWLYAAPVHLLLQRDSFSLAAPAPLQLESDEIFALTAAFNQHFEADKIQFFWHEDTWLLCMESHPNILTSKLEDALNKDISAFMPNGVGATKWASFINEVQMLLFEHPVNKAREAKHILAINSIWCYGGGQVGNAN
jgi:hypothetical protein